MLGESITHYRIESKLGEGGMGVVYKAFDTRLLRPVALKILPPHLVTDEKSLFRFTQEAQAASALNHPNICTIHDIDEQDGIHFIVMEFVEGETLRQTLERRGPLPEPEVIALGMKVADALQAAHTKGIIHRDLKPENIMISREGYVKVMDFGLAKLKTSETDANTASPAEESRFAASNLLKSSANSLQGTAAYMSPEQIEKQTVDHRSDIFSLGIVLYEMAFGAMPFKGTSNVEVMQAILRDAPEFVGGGKRQLSASTLSTIRRALNKHPQDRFQTMEALRQALAAQQAKQRTSHARSRRPLRLLLASLFAVSIGVLLVLKLAHQSSSGSLKNFANALQTVPFTSGPDLEDEPSLSPTGDRVAFTSDRAGNPDIWIKDIATGATINLTSDCAERDDSPRWSPDGKKIVFRSDREGGGIFIVDLAAHAIKRIAPWGAQPAWSPDGKQIAYKIDKPPIGKKICAIAVAGGAPRVIFETEEPQYISALAWSHDGQWLAFAFGNNMSWNIYVKSIARDELFQATDDTYFNYSPVWGERDEALFFRSDRGGVNDVWVRSIALNRRRAVGEAMPVTLGAELKLFDVVTDRRILVYSKLATRTNLFALDLSKPNRSPESRLRQITNWDRATLEPSLSPEGSKILFTSNVQGKYELWLCERDGSNPRLLHRPQDSSESPVWSPDGKMIAYIDGDGDAMELWTMNLANGEKRQLTKNNYADMKPDWSPDGKWIAYTAKMPEGELIVIPAAGGAARRLTFDPASDAFPKFSPDGKTIAFSSDRDGFQNIWTIPLQGGEPKQLTFDKEAGGLGLCWSPNGQFIYHVVMQSGVRNIWKVAVNGENREQITAYRYSTHHVHRMTSLATDGRELFFAVQERAGDLWLMKPR